MKDDGETLKLLNFELQAMLKRVVHSLGLVEQTDKKGSKSRSKTPPDFSTQSKDFVVRITHAGGQQELYRHAVPAAKLMTKYPGMCVATPQVFKVPHHSVLWREDLLLPGHKYILIPFKDVEKLKRKHPERGNGKAPNGVVVSRETLDAHSRSPSGHHTPKQNGKFKVPNGVALGGAEITGSPSGHSHKENGKMKEQNGAASQEMLEKRTALTPREDVVNTKMDESLVEDSFNCAKDFYVPKEKSPRPPRRKGITAKKPFRPPLPRTRYYRGLGWQPSLPTVKEISP